MATTSGRRTPARTPNRGPVVPGLVIAALAIALASVFVGCSGKKDDPTPGSAAAVKSANTLLAKALSEMNSGDLAKAKTDLQEVRTRDPKNKYAFYNLGYIAQTQGDKTGAETQYRLALAIDAQYDPALYNLAILRSAAGDTTGAITLYQQAIASNPKDASAHFNLGLLLRQTGHTADGNAQVQTAVGLSPALASAAQAQGVPASGG